MKFVTLTQFVAEYEKILTLNANAKEIITLNMVYD